MKLLHGTFLAIELSFPPSPGAPFCGSELAVNPELITVWPPLAFAAPVHPACVTVTRAVQLSYLCRLKGLPLEHFGTLHKLVDKIMNVFFLGAFFSLC